MHNYNFDAWTRLLVSRQPRRRVWRGLAGGALAALLPHFGKPLPAAARETAAKRCLKEGKSCKRGTQCCSGVCRKKKCRRATGQGLCTIRQDLCRTSQPGPGCGVDDGGGPCFCHVTAAGASFCASAFETECFPCAANGDCADVTGPDSACIRTLGTPFCDDSCPEQGAFCARPCT
jgi:hypothetical protein